jgi:hypothetical protein
VSVWVTSRLLSSSGVIRDGLRALEMGAGKVTVVESPAGVFVSPWLLSPGVDSSICRLQTCIVRANDVCHTVCSSRAGEAGAVVGGEQSASPQAARDRLTGTRTGLDQIKPWWKPLQTNILYIQLMMICIDPDPLPRPRPAEAPAAAARRPAHLRLRAVALHTTIRDLGVAHRFPPAHRFQEEGYGILREVNDTTTDVS